MSLTGISLRAQSVAQINTPSDINMYIKGHFHGGSKKNRNVLYIAPLIMLFVHSIISLLQQPYLQQVESLHLDLQLSFIPQNKLIILKIHKLNTDHIFYFSSSKQSIGNSQKVGMNYFENYFRQLTGASNVAWTVQSYIGDNIIDSLFFDVEEVNGLDITTREGQEELVRTRRQHESLNQNPNVRSPVRVGLPDMYFIEKKKRTFSKEMGKTLKALVNHEPNRIVVICWYKQHLPVFIILPKYISGKRYDSSYEIHWNTWGVGMPKELLDIVRSVTITNYATQGGSYDANLFENKLRSFMQTMFYYALIDRLNGGAPMANTLRDTHNPLFLFRWIQTHMDERGLPVEDPDDQFRYDDVGIEHLYYFFEFHWKAPLAGHVGNVRYDLSKLEVLRQKFVFSSGQSIFHPGSGYRSAFEREGWMFVNPRISTFDRKELDVSLVHAPLEFPDDVVYQNPAPGLINLADVAIESSDQ